MPKFKGIDLKRYHGIAPSAPPADWLSQVPMVALDPDSVSRVDPIEDIWNTPKIGGDRDKDYYDFQKCKRYRHHEQILESDHEARLQSNVQKLADQYINRNGRQVDHGKADGDK